MSSPTRYSRPQEEQEEQKEQDLQNLNDRLACYTENSSLKRKAVTTHETSSPMEKKNKIMYEHELSDARKLLDETTATVIKEHTKPEIDTKGLWDDNEDLKSKLEKKTKDLQTAERNEMIYETRYSDLQSQFNQWEAERKTLAEKNWDSEKENNRLKALLDDARKHLEEETLQRIDLENNIQTLKEHISFKDQVRTKRQVEISEIRGRLAESLAGLKKKLVVIQEEIGQRLEEYQNLMDI